MNIISSGAKTGFSGSAGGLDDPGTSKQKNIREAQGEKHAMTRDTPDTEGQPANRKVAKVTKQQAAKVLLKTDDSFCAADNDISPKAFPVAPPDLTVEILNLVNQAQSCKIVKKGINEVIKALDRQNATLVILAANFKPIESLLHLPLKCEEMNVPYVYVEDKHSLGRSTGITRPVGACCIAITPTHTHLSPLTETIINKVEKLLI